MKILMVQTSHDVLGNTGRKIAAPYFERAADAAVYWVPTL